MRKSPYDSLRNEYPEYVSLNQLYRICKIAKRSAAYLLHNRIIPCIDSGKQTHRYKVKLSDVIRYLKKRDTIGNMIPVGALSATSVHEKAHLARNTAIVSMDEANTLLEYYTQLTDRHSDVLSTRDISTLTGLSIKTIHRFLQNGIIQSVARQPRYLIPKPCFLAFVTSRHFIESKSTSKQFQSVLGGFQEWLNAK